MNEEPERATVWDRKELDTTDQLTLSTAQPGGCLAVSWASTHQMLVTYFTFKRSKCL